MALTSRLVNNCKPNKKNKAINEKNKSKSHRILIAEWWGGGTGNPISQLTVHTHMISKLSV